MVDGDQLESSCVLLLLHKDVTSVAVKTHKSEVKDCDLVNFIGRKKSITKVLDGAFALDEFLKGSTKLDGVVGSGSPGFALLGGD